MKKKKVRKAVNSKMTNKIKEKETELINDLASLKASVFKKFEDVHPSEWDYKKIALNAIKVAIPLVALKVIHSNYKSSHTRTAKLQKYFNDLLEDAKTKIKEM